MRREERGHQTSSPPRSSGVPRPVCSSHRRLLLRAGFLLLPLHLAEAMEPAEAREGELGHHPEQERRGGTRGDLDGDSEMWRDQGSSCRCPGDARMGQIPQITQLEAGPESQPQPLSALGDGGDRRGDSLWHPMGICGPFGARCPGTPGEAQHQRFRHNEAQLRAASAGFVSVFRG